MGRRDPFDGFAVGDGLLFTSGDPPSNDQAVVVVRDLAGGQERALSVALPGQFESAGAPALAYGGRRGSLFLAQPFFDRTVIAEADLETGAVRRTFEVPYQVRGFAYSDARGVLYLQDAAGGPGTATAVVDPDTGDAVGQIGVFGDALAADEGSVPLFLDAAPATGTLPPGGAATLTLRADGAGLIDGTYQVRADAEVGGEAVASLPITLTVVGRARIALDRTAVRFGDVLVGVLARDTVRVTNDGSAGLRASVSVEGASGFSASPSVVDLAPGASAAVAVAFQSASSGEARGTLRLVPDDSNVAAAAVVLSAAAVLPPDIAVAPREVSVRLDAGASTTRGLLVTNDGGTALDYTVRVEAESPPALFSTGGQTVRRLDLATFDELDSFRNSRTTFGGGTDGLASDGSLLYFAPTGKNEVFVYDPATGGVVRQFDLPVFGVQGLTHDGTRLYVSFGISQRDVVRLSPDGLSVEARYPIPQPYLFDGDMAHGAGVLYVLARAGGASRTSILRLDAETGAYLGEYDAARSDGIAFLDGALYLSQQTRVAVLDAATGAVLRESSDLSFGVGPLTVVESLTEWVRVSSAAGAIDPGASEALTVTLDAAGLDGGTYQAALAFASNDPEDPVLRVPVSLEVVGEPDLVLPDAPLAFGDVYVGARVQRRLRIGNAGTASLTVALSGPPGVAAEPAAFTLRPRADTSVVVTYAPSAAGALDAPLAVSSDDPDAPSAEAALVGSASAGPVAAVEAGFEGGVTVTAGQTASRRVTVRNAGPAPLAYTIVGRPASAPRPELLVADRTRPEAVRLDAVTGRDLGVVALPGEGTIEGLAASADSVYVLAERVSEFGFPVFDVRAHARADGRFVRMVREGVRELRGIGFGDGVLYARFGFDGPLTAIDVATGDDRRVEFEDGNGAVAPIGGVGAGAGLVFVETQDRLANTLGTVVLDAASGRTLQTVVRDGAASSSAYVDGRLFRVTFQDGGRLMSAFDPLTAGAAVGPQAPWPFVSGVGPTVRWIASGSVSGTVAPGATAEVEVPFGADGLAAGSYDGTLAVLTDDPAAQETTFEVRLDVEVASDAGAGPVGAFSVGRPYPNPTAGASLVSVDLPAPGEVEVVVFDALGRRVSRTVEARSAGRHDVRVGRESLPAGVYVARVTSGADVASRSFVVVR